MSNTSIVSNAAQTNTTTYSFTYNNTESRINIGNTYLPDSYSYDFEFDEYDEVFSAEDDLFWYLGSMASIFTTDSQYYGYRVVMERTSKTSISYSNCVESRWVLGTATDLMSGANVGNYDGVEAERVAFWIPSNHSQVQIRLAPLFRFSTHETSSSLGSYTINALYSFTIIGYKTEAEYGNAMNNIQNELQNQTQEMQNQTQEMEEQTGELKEQTSTQKGMLSKMTEFFGGFFDNLVDSVIGLFVPSSEEMSAILSRFNTFFEETFGVLFYPFTVLGRCINYLITCDHHTSAMFPSFSIMGYKVWDNIYFDLTSIPIVATIFGYVRTGMGVAITFAFINYMRNFFDKRFGGGGN